MDCLICIRVSTHVNLYELSPLFVLALCLHCKLTDVPVVSLSLSHHGLRMTCLATFEFNVQMLHWPCWYACHAKSLMLVY